MGSAEQSLYNGGDILKELGQTFEYDRTDGTNGTVKVIEPGKDKGDTSRICEKSVDKWCICSMGI